MRLISKILMGIIAFAPMAGYCQSSPASDLASYEAEVYGNSAGGRTVNLTVYDGMVTGSTNGLYVTKLVLTPGHVYGSVNGGFSVDLTISDGHVQGMEDDQRWPIDFTIRNGQVIGTAFGGGRVEVTVTSTTLSGILTGSPISLQLVGPNASAPPDEVVAALILAAGRRKDTGK